MQSEPAPVSTRPRASFWAWVFPSSCTSQPGVFVATWLANTSVCLVSWFQTWLLYSYISVRPCRK